MPTLDEIFGDGNDKTGDEALLEALTAGKSTASSRNSRKAGGDRLAADRAKGIEFSEDGRTLLKYPRNLRDKTYGIPNTVIEIGDLAFDGCDRLERVVIPDGVIRIGVRTFRNCCSLNRADLPGHLIEIGGYAFKGCDNLDRLYISDSVRSIGDGAFSPYTEVVVSSDNPAFYVDDGGELIERRRMRLLHFHGKYQEGYAIPKAVLAIGENAFFDCKRWLESVDIHNCVTEIGAGAFAECENLRQVTLPKHLTEIADYTFANCGLERVDIPYGVTRIGNSAFSGCGSFAGDDLEVTIPDSVTQIDEYAFDTQNLREVSVPHGCVIAENAFPENCRIIRRRS